jgi:SnoaL-like domain
MKGTQSMSSDTDIRYLLDRLEIQDVIARYALGQNVTQHDDILLDLWREVFTPDARLDYGTGGFGTGTYVELADWMRGDGPHGRMYEFTRWQHLLGLPTVTIDGDTATARTDLLVSHKAKPDHGAEQDSSWYITSAFALHDTLVRTADGWRISFRHLEVLQAAPPGARPGTHGDADHTNTEQQVR